MLCEGRTADNELLVPLSRLSATRDEIARRAAPLPSEEWVGTFSPGITVYPGSFSPAPTALL